MKKIKNGSKDKFNIFSIKLIYPMIFLCLISILTFCKPEILYFSLILILVIALVCIAFIFKEIKEKKYRVEELTKSIDIVLKENLDGIKIPMVLVVSPTKIVWQNEMSKHLLPEEYILDTAIAIENKMKQNEQAVCELELGNSKFYTAIGTNVKFSNFTSLLITYIDKTEENDLKKVLDDTRTSIGMIFIDNFEETMQGLDDIKKAQITLDVETTIREWVTQNQGAICKLEKDKYMIIVEKSYVDKMEQECFGILEKVKKITDLTKLPITISIGFSYSEDSLSDRYSSANSALDIALGRGGDQAVIKKDKKFSFYGGTSMAMEKTSRVRARTVSQVLKELILKSDKVYVIGHKNSDIDCVGAAIGVVKIAKVLGKEAGIIIDSKYNSSTKTVIDKIKSLEEYENIFLNYNDVKKQDMSQSLLVVVDTHKKSYLCYPEILDNFDKVVVIDHHRRGPEFIDNAVLTYHEIYASSACELVTELIMYMENVELNSVEAESLYAGIVVDTKNFMFKTGVRTFEVAAYLKKFGIDVTSVKQLFQNDFETYITKVEIVKNAEIIEGKVAISSCDEKIDDMPIVAAQAADELLSISGILASFVLCKVDDVVMISGRSMGDINVQVILEKIGGGGHLTFAGAQIAGITIEEAKETLKKYVKEYLEEN